MFKVKHKRLKRPKLGTVQASREGNGWKFRHYPMAEYIDLGWDLPFGIEPKIKDKNMKRTHRKRRQRNSLKENLRIEAQNRL